MTDMTATPQQPAPGGPETEIESAEAFAQRLDGMIVFNNYAGEHLLPSETRVAIEQRDAQIAAQARAQALRDAESKWGADHSWDCAGMIDAADCTCGWAIALAAAQEHASDPQPGIGNTAPCGSLGVKQPASDPQGDERSVGS